MKRNLFWMLASILSYGLTMTSLTSCEDNKDNPSGSEVPQFKVQKEDFKWDFTYKNKVYLDPRINKDLITTFDELMPNQQEAIDDDTKVVIISRFDDVPFEQLEAAYYSGATIVIAAPYSEDLHQFFNLHPEWEGYWTDAEMDEAFLYSFNINGDHFLVMGAVDPSTIEDEVSQYEAGLVPEGELQENWMQQAAYNNIGLWVDYLIDMESETDETRAAKARAVATRAAAQNKDMNIAECFAVKTYGKSFSFPVVGAWRNGQNGKAIKDFNKIAGIRVSYGVYSMHVYDNQKGQGDYYAVTMESSIANNNMLEKWYIWNWTWNDRGIGPYAKEFEAWTLPLDPQGNTYSDEVVFFPGGTSPVPETTMGQTTTSDEYSFSLKTDMTVSGSGKVAEKDGLTGELKIQAGISMGWNWAKKVQRTATDISYVKMVNNNNEQKHKIVFNNLPKADPETEFGFKEQEGNQSYKGTVDLKSAWIWYKPNVRDYSKEDPITMKFVGRYKYGWSWHDGGKIFGIGDYKPVEWTLERWVYEEFKLDPIVRDRYALIQLQNDFKDLYIYEISVDSPSAFNKVTEIKKSYSPGELITLSTYPVNGKYTITFKAGKNSSDVKSYRYNSQEFVPLNHLEPTVLKAAFDFIPN